MVPPMQKQEVGLGERQILDLLLEGGGTVARKVEAAERFVLLGLLCLGHAKGSPSMGLSPCLVACSFDMTEDLWQWSARA